MGKLIKFEFRRLFLQKSFYICMGAVILITALQISTSWSIRMDTGMDGAGFVQQSLINAGTTFLFVILLGIFSALFVSEDYSGGTIRVIVTRGYSRTEIYFAKLIVLCVGALTILFVCWLAAIVTAAVVSDGTSSSMNLIFLRAMLVQLLLIIAYACIFNAASSALQKNGAAIAVCIVLPLAVSIVLGFVSDSLNSGTAEQTVNISKYWLEALLSEASIVNPDRDSLNLALKAAPIYIAASAALGWLSIYKREY